MVTKHTLAALQPAATDTLAPAVTAAPPLTVWPPHLSVSTPLTTERLASPDCQTVKLEGMEGAGATKEATAVKGAVTLAQALEVAQAPELV